MCARVKELGAIQREFDTHMWYPGLHSDMEGMNNKNKGKHFREAGIFGRPEYQTVTTLFNQSPSSLKDSKPTSAQNQRTQGVLTSWNQRRVDRSVISPPKTKILHKERDNEDLPQIGS